jgi:hypothetical protein
MKTKLKIWEEKIRNRKTHKFKKNIHLIVVAKRKKKHWKGIK